VKELVGEKPEQPMYLDRQAALVFELRHFPGYYEDTERMLKNLRHSWNQPQFVRVIEEIDLTLKHIRQ